MLRTTLLLLFAFSAGASEWLSGTWIHAERKLDAAIEKADGAAKARLLAKRAFLFLDRSSYHRLGVDEARKALDEARAAAAASGDRIAMGDAALANARWYYWRKLVGGVGEWSTVDAALDEALRIREQSDAWFYRGLVRQMQEDYAPAREAFERSLSLAKDPLMRSFSHRHLGYVIQLSGDLASARKHYTLSLELREKAGAHALVPFSLNLLADFELETTNDRARAKDLLHDAARTARCAKSWRALNAAEGMLAEMYKQDGDLRNARKHAGRAVQAAETYGEAEMIAEARHKLDAM